MTFSEPASHSEPLLKFLDLLKFPDIFHLGILSFVYQCFNKINSPCFTDYFKPISSVHSYYTHQSPNQDLFVYPVQATQYGIHSLDYTGTKLWNSLPSHVKKITAFFTYRQNVKKSMIDGYKSVIDSWVIYVNMFDIILLNLKLVVGIRSNTF